MLNFGDDDVIKIAWKAQHSMQSTQRAANNQFYYNYKCRLASVLVLSRQTILWITQLKSNMGVCDSRPADWMLTSAGCVPSQ